MFAVTISITVILLKQEFYRAALSDMASYYYYCYTAGNAPYVNRFEARMVFLGGHPAKY